MHPVRICSVQTSMDRKLYSSLNELKVHSLIIIYRVFFDMLSLLVAYAFPIHASLFHTRPPSLTVAHFRPFRFCSSFKWVYTYELLCAAVCVWASGRAPRYWQNEMDEENRGAECFYGQEVSAFTRNGIFSSTSSSSSCQCCFFRSASIWPLAAEKSEESN